MPPHGSVPGSITYDKEVASLGVTEAAIGGAEAERALSRHQDWGGEGSVDGTRTEERAQRGIETFPDQQDLRSKPQADKEPCRALIRACGSQSMAWSSRVQGGNEPGSTCLAWLLWLALVLSTKEMHIGQTGPIEAGSSPCRGKPRGSVSQGRACRTVPPNSLQKHLQGWDRSENLTAAKLHLPFSHAPAFASH